MDRKTKMKIGYFITKTRKNRQQCIKHGIPDQNSTETSEHKPHRTKTRKRTEIAHHKLTLPHDGSNPKTV